MSCAGTSRPPGRPQDSAPSGDGAGGSAQRADPHFFTTLQSLSSQGLYCVLGLLAAMKRYESQKKKAPMYRGADYAGKYKKHDC